MLSDQAKFLAAFYIRPRKAPGEVLDQGSLGAAIVLALLVALLLKTSAAFPFHQQWHDSLLTIAARFIAATALGSLFLNAALLVPLSLALLSLIEGRPRTAFNVQQNFAGMLSCTLFAWSAAYLPAALLQRVVPALVLASPLYFLVLAVFSLRAVMGSRHWPAIASVLLGSFLANLFGILASSIGGSYLFASPFLLYYLWVSFGSSLTQLGGLLGKQQSFRRHLEALTLNERDADAHYQLGLLYTERRDWQRAETRFRRAAEIDPQDPDYALALGRTLRELGQPDAALTALQQAARNNDQAGANEVWRELGAAYLAHNQPDLAATALHKYVARREYDPEGALLLGKALRALGQPAAAQEQLRNAIRAAESMPHHRRAEARHWASKAKQELRSLS